MTDEQLRALLAATDRLDQLCTELRMSRGTRDHRWRNELQGVLIELHSLISEIQHAHAPAEP